MNKSRRGEEKSREPVTPSVQGKLRLSKVPCRSHAITSSRNRREALSAKLNGVVCSEFLTKRRLIKKVKNGRQLGSSLLAQVRAEMPVQ